MSTSRNIVLVGFMGTGKTSTGQCVAKALGREFIDADDEIVRREGRDIPAIFATSGEPYFRQVERAVIQSLAAREDLVIAPGGGAIMNPDNIADLSRTGVVMCLRATPEMILKRVGDDPNRPLLRAPDRLERIRELLARRAPLYDSIPIQVETDGQTPEEVAVRVLEIFRGLDGAQ